MKIAVFGPHRRVGVVVDDDVVDAHGAYTKYLAESTDTRRPSARAAHEVPSDLNSFIEQGDSALAAVRAALDHLSDSAVRTGAAGEQLVFALDSVRLHAPIETPSRIFAALANFADHMQAAADNTSSDSDKSTLGRLVSGGPKFFVKDPRVVSADGDDLPFPRRTDLLDYEAEVAVVLGRRGKDIAADDFGSYIYGYTLVNDWSIRDNVSFGPDFQYSKNFDGSATVGPWIVVDEGLDAQDIAVESRVNGEVRQSGSTKSMIHSFAALGAYLSRDSTLFPGDLISGGTPKGTAVDSSPRDAEGKYEDDSAFLSPGDVVEVSSDVIGSVTNTISGTRTGVQ
ncbi:fumarylacetoacetate hydrolase family protein [Rhodococcus sp. BP-149]|jgi:2-keto-4-pentenoate hydratase/2-oxohepta-3-ene-1,7-dioic acid hydratase in catechol pathway|uniref:fumarylacetoacetate hydrolase family protein n=1 Tax=unclassified Rhodococcus (in: high G+C Gram-positive bacteria) TaxID=192944 RepID=UPI001C9B52D2|nr:MULTISPECIES: fumarylacetoacetate hydrolase family protein [unclassified Rhodococcus (in: high G+C Gram-positive bacteria)]MBY6685602.1 fumarylacetoacetate hydrolase family protein [Rhodococcus sp. BP-288]MBY6694850.1 fumarylacetoacetate hydrolase family protein [Rhodococcus sp. BP-188]MBY6696696.1 fumarylacetoacetate hydrolase family protein [Rhodococcus sp. BP-285]MBY6703352.1 fumarylacetoacetate hydrolase family protein [Rhodococcus sp. BP-283]MBY6708675.1 fumarylacetoacetate hydrolase f